MPGNSFRDMKRVTPVQRHAIQKAVRMAVPRLERYMSTSREAMNLRNKHGRQYLRRELKRIIKLAWHDTVTYPRNKKRCKREGHLFDDQYSAVCSRCYEHMMDVDSEAYEAWRKRLHDNRPAD